MRVLALLLVVACGKEEPEEEVTLGAACATGADCSLGEACLAVGEGECILVPEDCQSACSCPALDDICDGDSGSGGGGLFCSSEDGIATLECV